MSIVKLDIKREGESSEVTKEEIVTLENPTVIKAKQNVKQEIDKDKNFKNQPKNGLQINKTKSGFDASLEFEEVSPLSSPKCSDITISSIESYEDDVENIIICVGNELAYQNYQDSEKDVYKNGCPKKQDDKTVELYKESRRSYDKYNGRSSRWNRSIDRTKKKERSEDSRLKFKHSPCRAGSRSRYPSSRSRRSRSWDRSRRRYLSGRSRRSRSWDRSRRRRESRSLSYRKRKKYSRSRSRSCSNSNKSPRSNLERRGSLTKKKRLSSGSPVRSVWKLLDRRKVVDRHGANSPKPPKTPPPPKSPPPAQPLPPPLPEQHPIIPLPQSQPQLTTNVTNVISSSYPWLQRENNSQNVYPFQNPPMPRVSVNNLPLVPGLGNLPMHVTMTGEQILHDMEGRPIPVGPNGLLLPLDLSGRLYPHIVFPCNNQAVPIYMSEDGVLRLPNGEPVPYGPPNQLPINVDGRFIPISSDSRPLHPCSNIPKQNPLIASTAANPVVPFVALNESQCVQQTQNINPPLPAVKEISRNGAQRLRELPPAVIQIKTMPEVRVKKSEVVNVQISSEPGGKNKPKENVQKCNVNKVERKKPYEDVDLPKLVEKFSERINKINISAIYQKKIKIQGIKEAAKDERIDDGASNTKLEMDSKKDKGVNEENPNSRKGNESSLEESHLEKIYIGTIREAISFFDDIDFRPPLYGRFLFSESSTNLKLRTPFNESPLLKNKLQLPFLSPEYNGPEPKIKKPSIAFRFLPQKDVSKGGNILEGGKISPAKVNYGVQCDFTTKTFKILQGKIDKLKRDLFRCRNENAELQDLYNALREDNEKKTEELGKILKKRRNKK